MAGKKKSASANGEKAEKTMNKSEFVRSLPADMPGKEVVEKAKEQGIKLSVAYVYSIRTAAKANASKGGGGAPASGGGSAAAPASTGRRGPGRLPALSTGSSRVEDLLRAVAAELGLSHAIGILQAEQAKVRAVLGG